MKNQCIIFDMDGVIIDSEPIHIASEKEIFNRMGIRLSDEEHHSFVGTTSEIMWGKLKSKFNLPFSVSELVELNTACFMKNLENRITIEPIEGILNLIKQLDNEGFILVLASSSHSSQISYILNKLKLSHYFQSIISANDVKHGKPNPEIFLKAAESVHLDADCCIVIEDSYNGVIAAKNANMKCIGFKNPNSGNQDLSKVDIEIKSFKELSVEMIRSLI